MADETPILCNDGRWYAPDGRPMVPMAARITTEERTPFRIFGDEDTPELVAPSPPLSMEAERLFFQTLRDTPEGLVFAPPPGMTIAMARLMEALLHERPDPRPGKRHANRRTARLRAAKGWRKHVRARKAAR